MKRLMIGLALVTVTAVAACKRDEAAASSSAPVDMERARIVFNEKCANCHGEAGRGDGPGAATLNPKPRNYTDKAWQKTATDNQLRSTILYGGAGVGKSPIMPASPELSDKPEVVQGLVRIVRDFGK